VIWKTIRGFLDCSDAAWLLFLSDGPFVKVPQLESLIASMNTSRPADTAKIAGQCSEVRDYFQIYAKNSGGLLSRRAAALMNATQDACEIEIDGSEAMSHVLDVNGLYALLNEDSRFLGDPFLAAADCDALTAGRFHGLKSCPAQCSEDMVCHNTVQRMRDLVIWAGERPAINKLDFLRASSRQSPSPSSSSTRQITRPSSAHSFRDRQHHLRQCDAGQESGARTSREDSWIKMG
jgi:hypothetical protein